MPIDVELDLKEKATVDKIKEIIEKNAFRLSSGKEVVPLNVIFQRLKEEF